MSTGGGSRRARSSSAHPGDSREPAAKPPSKAASLTSQISDLQLDSVKSPSSKFARVPTSPKAEDLPDGGYQYPTGSSRGKSSPGSLPLGTPEELDESDRPVPKAFDHHKVKAENFVAVS